MKRPVHLFRSASHCLALLLSWSLSTLAAPLPSEGHLTSWKQPNGRDLPLRIFGDDTYGRATTLQGYSVLFDEHRQAYVYAKLSADGSTFEPTASLADGPPPAGLSQGLQESADTVASKRASNDNRFAKARAQRWAARVANVRNSRNLSPNGLRMPLAANTAISGTKVGLMLLVQFPDDAATSRVDIVNFPTTKAKVERYANAVGYKEDGNFGSIRDYFYDQSGGMLTLNHAVPEVVTLPYPRSYYNFSDYPRNTTLPDSGISGRLIVADAIAKLRFRGFDFSQLTTDEDGNVLAVSVLFAGKDSGVWARGLWPHSWGFDTPVSVGTEAAPSFIANYQITNVATAAIPIGTNCHEISHLLLDYPDFYDTEQGDGDSSGVGFHCLMGAGNYLNKGRTPAPLDLYLKDYSGWANVRELAQAEQADIPLATTGNTGLRWTNPADPKEYFLFENRGTGDPWAKYAPDKGVIVWHVDENVTTGNDRQHRTKKRHYMLSLVQADGRFDLERNVNAGDASDLFDLKKGTLNNNSSPAANWWSGQPANLSLNVLGLPAASMTLRLGTPITGPLLHVNPTVVEQEPTAATQSFDITATGAWTWKKNVSWITSTEPSSQIGPQEFTYGLAANTSQSRRTGTITISSSGKPSRTFSVTQEGIAGDDHSDTTTNATTTGLNATTKGNLEEPGDYDYFKFTVTTPGWLSLETKNLTDTVGHLYNANGTELATDDESGVDSNFRFGAGLLSGTYYLRISHYVASGTGSYQLVTKFTSSPTLSISPSFVSLPGVGGTPTLSVKSNTLWTVGSDVDWLQTNEDEALIGSQYYTVHIQPNPTPFNRIGRLYLTAGPVERVYTISQAGALPDDFANTASAAAPLALNVATKGNFETPGDTDFFQVTIPQHGSLQIQSIGRTDTVGALLRADGSQIALDDDSGLDANFSITTDLPAGTYYVRLSHFLSTEPGSYAVKATFKPTTSPAAAP